MPFNRPSLEEIVARVQTDIEGALEGADARLRRSVENALSLALGGASHTLHAHLDWSAAQLFPDSAEREHVVRHAGVYGLTRKPPTAAQGYVTITGVNGSVSPSGTLRQRAGATVYEQLGDATITGGAATILVRATTKGIGTNAEAGTVLSLVSPVVGVAAEGEVDVDGITGGVDEEKIEELRARLLARMRLLPQGGGAGDYVQWALEMPGVTRAWERALWAGPGRVGVAFLMNGAVPDSGQLEAMRVHLQARAPLTVEVVVFAPSFVATDFTIACTPNTLAVRNAVEAELAALFEREADLGSTIYLSRSNAAIAAAPGLHHHVMSSPLVDQTATASELRTLGTVNFV